MTPSPIPRKERSEEQSADRCNEAGTTQQSGEKHRGRDKARKRRGASGGGSGSGALQPRLQLALSDRPLGTLQWAPQLQQLRRLSEALAPRDHRRRPGSKPKPPRRDEKARRRRSPAPKPSKVHFARLTRKVTREHIREIFSTFGRVRDRPAQRKDARASASRPRPRGVREPGRGGEGAQAHGRRANRRPADHGHSRAGPPASATPQATEPSPENAATALHVAQAEEQVASPLGQVPRAPATPLPPPPPSLERLQLQLLPKVRAAVDTCPRAAELQLQGCCWFGAVLVKVPSSVLAGKLPSFCSSWGSCS